MKRAIIISMFLIMITAGIAGAAETLFDGPLTVDGNVALTGVVTTWEEEALFLLGGNWTALVNHTLILGSGWYITPFAKSPANDKIRYAYGGPIGGWTFFPEKMLHFSLECLFGTGSAWYRTNKEDNQAFFVVEPQGTLELNVSEHFHIGVGGGYRFSFGIPAGADVSNRNLSGPYGELLLKFGDF